MIVKLGDSDFDGLCVAPDVVICTLTHLLIYYDEQMLAMSMMLSLQGNAKNVQVRAVFCKCAIKSIFLICMSYCLLKHENPFAVMDFYLICLFNIASQHRRTTTTLILSEPICKKLHYYLTLLALETLSI